MVGDAPSFVAKVRASFSKKLPIVLENIAKFEAAAIDPKNAENADQFQGQLETMKQVGVTVFGGRGSSSFRARPSPPARSSVLPSHPRACARLERGPPPRLLRAARRARRGDDDDGGGTHLDDDRR